jgi:hypothetical protein
MIIERNNNVASMKIETLETALLETKLKMRREREQAQMGEAEHESALLNS